MADAWGGSWGAAWGVSWGYSAAVAGGAGSGGTRGRRQFPFRNRYDDPDLFRPPPPPPEAPEEPVVDQPYSEGDPVNVAPAGPTIMPFRRAPPVMPPLSTEVPRLPKRPAPPPPPPDPAELPLSDEEEREEEEAVMRALGFYD